VYGVVPPEATTVALPLHAALQFTLTCDCVAVSAVGCVIVNVFVRVHPFASVIVQVYDPAPIAVDVAPVPPLGVHAYVYGVVPPETVTPAEVVPPLQAIVPCVVVAVSAAGCVMLKVFVSVQPFASVIVQV
jgi:hypothetical protein